MNLTNIPSVQSSTSMPVEDNKLLLAMFQKVVLITVLDGVIIPNDNREAMQRALQEEWYRYKDNDLLPKHKIVNLVKCILEICAQLFYRPVITGQVQRMAGQHLSSIRLNSMHVNGVLAEFHSDNLPQQLNSLLEIIFIHCRNEGIDIKSLKV